MTEQTIYSLLKPLGMFFGPTFEGLLRPFRRGPFTLLQFKGFSTVPVFLKILDLQKAKIAPNVVPTSP